MSQGFALAYPMAQGHYVYALARQSLGNFVQAVIGSTQDPFELLFLKFDNIGPYAFTLVTVYCLSDQM